MIENVKWNVNRDSPEDKLRDFLGWMSAVKRDTLHHVRFKLHDFGFANSVEIKHFESISSISTRITDRSTSQYTRFNELPLWYKLTVSRWINCRIFCKLVCIYENKTTFISNWPENEAHYLFARIYNRENFHGDGFFTTLKSLQTSDNCMLTRYHYV